MSDVLRRLAIELGIDTAVFEEGLHESVHMFSEAMHEITKSAVISGELIAEGIKEGAEALKEMAEEAIKFGAEIADSAQKYGMTTEALSVLSVAASLSGTSFEEAAGGIKHLNDNMSKAGAGNAQANEAFKALGISVNDANGHIKKSSDVLAEISEKFHGAEDDANKTAIAVAIFGKNGADMIPMLNEGKEGMDSATKAATEYGLVLSGPAAKAAKETEDRMELLHLAAKGQAQTFMAELMPSVLKVADGFHTAGNGMNFMKEAADAASFIIKILASGLYLVKNAIEFVADTLARLAVAAGDVLHGQFSEALEVMRNNAAFKDMRQNLVAIAGTWADTGDAAEGAAGKLEDSAAKAKESLKGISGEKKEKKEKSLPDFFTEDKEMRKRSDEEFKRWTEEQARADKEIENLQRRLMTKRELEEADFAKQKDEVQHAVQIKAMTEQEGMALIERLTAAHNQKLIDLDAQLLEEKFKNIMAAEDFTKSSLDQIGAHSKAAAAAARIISKAQALTKIAHDTPAAAMAAASAVASIPVVGPALAVAASASMYALGAAAAASVVSDSGQGGSSGSAGTINASSVTPTAAQAAPGGAPPNTILHIPENAIFTGRQLLQYLSDALADNGGKIGNLQVVGV